MGVFKAYDVRGVYGEALTDELAYRIGFFLPRIIEGKKIAVGSDMRNSSPKLKEELIRGLADAGCIIYDIGLISTPMINFAVVHHGLDGGVQITASHNGPKYNGFKVAKKNAVPVGFETGLDRLEKLCAEEELSPGPKGRVEKLDIMPEYIMHVRKFLKTDRHFRIAIDAGNGMAGHTVPGILKDLSIAYDGIYMEPDGNFPNHEADPLKEENLRDIKKKVREGRYDFGIAFDGDADRIMFIDEKGENIAADIVTAMLGEWFVRKGNDGVIYDVRSTKMIRESVSAAGGHSYLCQVGHAYLKKMMREKDAFFGGELAGHFYFKENFYTDSGVITLMKMLNFLAEKNAPLSELAAAYKKYFPSGEINSEVDDKDGKIEEVSKAYSDGEQFRVDGLTVIYDRWWFNIRKSNTEPLLRLVLEAETEEIMKTRSAEVLKKIRG